MPLVEHLRELRARILKSLAALGVGAAVAYGFFPPIFRFLSRPYCQLPSSIRHGSGGCSLYFFGVLDGIIVRIQVSLLVGALLSAPVWLYQLAAFVTPGLRSRERRWAYPFVLASMALFALGAAFAYLTLDKGLQFLLGASGSQLVPLLDARRYLTFFILMVVAFGVSFEFPLALAFLEIIGVVSAAKLRRWRRGMYFGLAVFSAVITPSQDPFTFLAMWAPLCLFYEAVILFARLHARARARRPAAATDQWPDDRPSPL